ncbi:MAG: hypothetical protein D6800_06695 [Candidatus Zixiibacteriota bacterium]|nr:MAG: hypothetical protein D6800_06695 [candidate division Zixibacteria bacterium]
MNFLTELIARLLRNKTMLLVLLAAVIVLLYARTCYQLKDARQERDIYRYTLEAAQDSLRLVRTYTQRVDTIYVERKVYERRAVPHPDSGRAIDPSRPGTLVDVSYQPHRVRLRGVLDGVSVWSYAMSDTVVVWPDTRRFYVSVQPPLQTLRFQVSRKAPSAVLADVPGVVTTLRAYQPLEVRERGARYSVGPAIILADKPYFGSQIQVYSSRLVFGLLVGYGSGDPALGVSLGWRW